MIKIKVIMVSILVSCSLSSIANGYESGDVTVKDLIENFAQLRDTNFVVSPKVKGRVELLGTTLENMSKDEFIEILEYHDFIATRKDGVVYIFTRFEVEHLGKGVGPIWQG